MRSSSVQMMKKNLLIFKQYDIDPYYNLSVCQKHPNFSKNVHQISLEMMVSIIQNNAFLD
jgi:hypothetical protein